MLQLRDIMTTDVATVHPETSLREAVELLAGRHISGAPVVANGRVLGVVSTSDLLAFMAAPPVEPTSAPEEAVAEDAMDGDADDEPWDDADGEPPARYFAELWSRSGRELVEQTAEVPPAVDPLREHTVSEAMTPLAFSLPPTADVSAAAEYMQVAQMHRVLVMERGRLVGLVTTADIARAVAEQRITRRVYCFDDAAGREA